MKALCKFNEKWWDTFRKLCMTGVIGVHVAAMGHRFHAVEQQALAC